MTTLTHRRLQYRLLERYHRQKGLTLVELLVVVIILGVLSAIAIPAFLNQQGRARIFAAQTAVMDVARGCAAAQVTNEQGDFNTALDASVTGTCSAAGGTSTFTSVAADFGTTQQAVATVDGNGNTSLTGCAAATGWTNPNSNAPGCTPTRA